jgi:hypothetical protein
VLLEIDAEPAGGEAAVAVRLLPRHQRRELERLRIVTRPIFRAVTSARTRFVAFQRPPEDRSSVALRGRRSSSRGRDGLASLEGTQGCESLRVIRGERSRAASRAHAPSPRGVYAPVVSLKPLGSRTKIRLSLGKFQPLACLRRAPALPPKTFGQRQTYGEAAELGGHDDLCEPGPGIWPLRLAKCQRRGEDGRSPGLRTFLPCAETRSSGSSDLLPTLERPPLLRSWIQQATR